MRKKPFDTSIIIGILLSIASVLVSLYTPPKKIPWEYTAAGLLLFMISIGIMILRVLSNIKEELKEIDKKVKLNENNFIDLNKRFKTLEDLSNIRLDIRELKRKVFKK